MTKPSVTEQKNTSRFIMKVRLATPLPFADGCLDYLSAEKLTVGQIVIVPLGKRQVAGVVIGEADDTTPPHKLKSIITISDLPPLSERFLSFISQVARWTVSSEGAVLKMALPIADALSPKKLPTGWMCAPHPPTMANITPKRQQVLDRLANHPPMPTSEAAQKAGVSTGVITQMAKIGLLDATPMTSPVLPTFDSNFKPAKLITLNEEQANAVAILKNNLKNFSSFVLDGVTGSGKTEVYLDAATSALENGQQVLILLPEIALSPMIQNRFTERFGQSPVVWHSALTLKQRIMAYRSLAAGGPRVVIGARSALFLPYPDLGMIIVDEEHDHSYKQDDHVAYHARDMAVLRGQREQILVILASATPSLETEYNIDNGRYKRLCLTARVGTAVMPKLELIDLRRTPPLRQQWIAPPLIEAMGEALESGQQSLLFLNRRGYAPITLCRTCGERLTCPDCSTWLVTHKKDFKMRCHYCDFAIKIPEMCPSCEDSSSLVPCGPGVERLAEEVEKHFPEARRAVLSSDLVTSQKNLEAFMAEAESGQVDIIIGTQMIAKGHHFPNLTLVGVVDADLGLAGGDLRAAETTWQLMIQVAGRAGREGEKGKAMLQTVAPETAVFQALVAGDREAFLQAEKSARAQAEMPPYGRLAALILSSENPDLLHESAKKLASCRPHFGSVSILGPAEAPIALLRGRHRLRFLIKAPRNVDIQKIIADWLSSATISSALRLQVDIDPYNFL